jgi:adenylosuccinate lyase
MPSHALDSAFFKDLYGSAAMRAVFDDDALLQKWLDVEAALARAEAALGIVPAAAAAEITRQADSARFDKAMLKKEIDRTAHPLVAVIWQLSAQCAGDAGRYVHWGATTQDIMDTALVLQCKDAYPLLEATLHEVIDAAVRLAQAHHATLMAGRTHGQHALPITFGFKAAVWVAELRRHIERLDACKPRLLVGQLAGAAGTLASIGDQGFAVQAAFMAALGLGTPDIAWHTARDSFAEFAAVLGMITATCGKIAHEIIDLQKTETAEVEEPFEMGKVGSSTMPQKRNPMLCEAILTMARLARADVTSALDAMLHEHERDWSSVQMDWKTIPELCILAHGALALTARVLSGLHVYPQAMLRNVQASGGLMLAERVMLALGQQIGRQDAHDVVYAVAMRAFEQHASFAALLKAEPLVRAHLSADVIDALLDPAQYTGLASAMALRVVGSG